MQQTVFYRAPQRLVGTKQMLLADDLIKVLRSQSVGQRAQAVASACDRCHELLAGCGRRRRLDHVDAVGHFEFEQRVGQFTVTPFIGERQ